MDMIDAYVKMDVGFGVKPEILMFQDTPNYILFRISKWFKNDRHYIQFSVLHPAINKKYKDEFKYKFDDAVLKLQDHLDHYNEND